MELVKAEISKKRRELTEREKEVLILLADGYSNDEVASMIGFSRRTVEAHRSRVMLKLRINNLPGLVKYAIRTGLTSTFSHRGQDISNPSLSAVKILSGQAKAVREKAPARDQAIHE